jgi:DNA-binding IclR family transcriptional regulator
MDESNESDGRTLGTINNMFDMVEILENSGRLGVSELAEQMNTSRSNAHLYLSTMRERGFVVKDRSKYKLSYRWLGTGGIVRNQERLFEVGYESIDKLAERTGELANLGVEQNGFRVLLYKSEGADAVTDKTPIGEHTYMHWSALGKAILASMDDERVESIIQRQGLPAATEQSIDNEAELFEHLDTIREEGYAFEDEEREHAMRAVAVAITNPESRPIGSVSISGPKHRITRARIEDEILDEMRSEADAIGLRYSNY